VRSSRSFRGWAYCRHLHVIRTGGNYNEILVLFTKMSCHLVVTQGIETQEPIPRTCYKVTKRCKKKLHTCQEQLQYVGPAPKRNEFGVLLDQLPPHGLVGGRCVCGKGYNLALQAILLHHLVKALLHQALPFSSILYCHENAWLLLQMSCSKNKQGRTSWHVVATLHFLLHLVLP